MKSRSRRPDIGLILAVSLAAMLVGAGASAAGPGDSDCMACHAEVKPRVVLGVLRGSAHEGLSCTSCHADITAVPHGKPLAVDCGLCHAKEADAWRTGPHAKAGGPGCVDCHGAHDVPKSSDRRSMSSHERQIEACGGCHARLAGGRQWVKMFDESVHGQGVIKQGLNLAPACATCHGAHDVRSLKADDDAKAKREVARLCGSCHEPAYAAYEKSAHYKALSQNVGRAPGCTDCHGEHSIQAPENRSSSVSPESVPATCGRCHADKSLMANFGLPADRLSTYLKSYHGVVLEMGDLRAANCASCHGAHDILPSSDPASRTNPSNLEKTCGKCHPGAGRAFSKIRFHESVSPTGARGAWFVRVFYTAFISLLVAGFLLHIITRLLGWQRTRRKSGAPLGKGVEGGGSHDKS